MINFPRRISDIIGIAEANLTHELCRLPANHFTDKNLVNLVAARWKKHGSDYQSPVPALDLTTGAGGRAFVTWEERQEEVQRRKQLKNVPLNVNMTDNGTFLCPGGIDIRLLPCGTKD